MQQEEQDQELELEPSSFVGVCISFGQGFGVLLYLNK